MGMDKALLGKYPDENTLKHWEKRACVLFLSDVWGGKCQLLRSLLSLHDDLRVAFIPESELPSAQTNQIYFKFFHYFHYSFKLGPCLAVILIVMVVLVFYADRCDLYSSQNGLEYSSVSPFGCS